MEIHIIQVGQQGLGRLSKCVPLHKKEDITAVHQWPGLISIYLAGEDKSTKNVPATTESTI